MAENRVLVDGSPVPLDGRHLEKRSDSNMQKEYVRLSEEELAKGFVRPVRRSYVHLRCGTATKMNIKLAETYARNPAFYTGTYCVDCDEHFPVGPNGEFTWEGTDEKVGT